jgi:hypothetical protein
MRNLLVSAVAALAFLAPSPARAVMFVGARVGYALPSGDVQKDDPVKDSISGTVPIQLDAGMSVLGILSLGVYGSYGPSMLAKDLENSPFCSGVSCSSRQLRAGIQLNVSPPVTLKSLWGGVFAGLEQQKLSVGSADLAFRGWEAGLQAGYDFSVLPFIKMGPYASYSFAQFTSTSGDAPELGTKARHTALTFGLRGLFDF